MKGKHLNYFTAVLFLSKYIRKHKRNFIMFYIGWFFDMLLSITMPIMFGIMVDQIVYHQNLDAFLRISLVFVIMSIFSCLLYFLIYAQHQYLMTMYVYDIQRDIFRHLQKCDSEYMSNAKTGDIISIIQDYSRECMHFVIRNIIHTANACINLILLTTYIFMISHRMGLLILIAVPISIGVSSFYGKKIRNYAIQQREHYGGYISYVYEIITGIRDIRLLGATKKVNRDIVNRHRSMFNVNIKAGISTITAQNIIEGTNLFIKLAIFTMSALLIRQGRMTIGLLTVIVAYFSTITNKVMQVSDSYLDAQNRIGYIQRIYDFMSSPSEETWEGKAPLKVSRGEISFEGVAFSYQVGYEVLKGFSLRIKSGERFAICGKSGCGKTTIGYLLMGFFKVQRGAIIIDGQRLSDCSLRSIRENIGLVSQDVLLFEGSIKDNLLLGKPKATDDEIIAALQASGIWETISELPDGINTMVSNRGIGLSGGQRQRIAIARIYLKNPKIIIFDEATAALDSETERHIHEAWESVLNGRTAIIIAHRLSSVMLCEGAAIMENGEIVAVGAPEDMERSCERFDELFALKGEVGYVDQY